MLKNILNFILLFFVILIVGMFLNEVLDSATQRSQIGFCNQHNQYDKTLQDYWVSEKDAEDCKKIGVPLTAKVKTPADLKAEEAEFKAWQEANK